MNMYTFKSRLRDLYDHPLGNDVITKILLQIGGSPRLVMNPVVGALPLSFLNRLAAKKLGSDFFEAILTLLNQSPDRLEAVYSKDGRVTQAWWKEAVIYQIYPRSFMDGNGDGVGDLPGILSKLDYLKDLGVDALWLSPIYDSPGDDNGYDIRDYQKIDPQFGTMEDFDLLLKEIHARGMRLVMDLVVNHTSDEHRWFREALASPGSPYRDYYFLQKKPNNWTSFFSGSAWNEYPKQEFWGLHLFSRKQMDLNWENPQLRQDVYAMIRWWLEKGVDGFRLDVINYISKSVQSTNGVASPYSDMKSKVEPIASNTECSTESNGDKRLNINYNISEQILPEGNAFIGELMGFTGIEHYFYGPRLHQYLQEMQREAFAPYHAFSVGETPGIGMQTGKLLTDDSRGELNMMFSFDHLETAGHARFDIYEYDLNFYKDYIIDWMEHFADTSWMSLFYDNHDNPRMLSKIDHSHSHRQVLAKLLAMIQMTLKGTPFLFQGQELGMINQKFRDIDDCRDVETINKYKELCEKLTGEEAFRHILAGSRDNARTPVQWSDEPGCGFTDAAPWIASDGDEAVCNARMQLTDPDSVLAFYRRMITLRKVTPAFVYGDIRFTYKKKKDILTYTRQLDGKTFLIICNISSKEQVCPGQTGDGARRQLILSNYPNEGSGLRAYEGRIYQI